MLNKFLALPETIQRKRDEIFGSYSSLRPLVLSKFWCKLCYETLDSGCHDKALDHFLLHIWCDISVPSQSKSQFAKANMNENNAPVKLEDKYGLTSWLNHNKYILEESTIKKLKSKFAEKVSSIITGKWCCLCQADFCPPKFLQHYTDHLEPLAIREISTWGLTCKQCNEPNNEFFTFQNLKHHYIEKHFKSKVVSVIADIPDVPFVLQLRKEMNVSSVSDLNGHERERSTSQSEKNSSTNPNIKNNHKTIDIKSCPEEPLPFFQQLTAVYGSELTMQTSEGSYSTATGLQERKRNNSNLKRLAIENNSLTTAPTIMTKILLEADSTHDDNSKSQCNSVSVHEALKPECLDTYPPHKWLCDGRLLLLLDPIHPKNIDLFKSQWRLGQPILIANSSEYLNKNLWHPKAFLRDFGHLRHDLINCLTGQTVPKVPLQKFWQGFSSMKDRLKDSNDTPMLLKLKDWPPSSDLSDYMPRRFQDLFSAFPMKIYTMREGELNLAGYLPEYCLKPELGPKMYIAYGSALYSSKASTNLHIDMSDAVNCLVYVGIPDDGDMKESAKQVLREVDKAGCDILMKRRVRIHNAIPGALWHIFHPKHTSTIRNFLNKVALENGKRLDPHDDPIHDQSTYLDANLRIRLYKEYGIQGN